MKTAKIAAAVCFEFSCPDCGPESQVEGPTGSLYITVEEIIYRKEPAYCRCCDCGSALAMPRLPKRVRTTEVTA